MSLEQLIEKHLDNSDCAAAFALWESQGREIAYPLGMRLAKAYYVQQDYQKALGLLVKLRPNIISELYECRVLQFKCQYLLQMACDKTLRELQILMTRDGIEVHHKSSVAEFNEMMTYRRVTRQLDELRKEGREFQKLYQQEEDRGAFNFQGFPMFLLPSSWFRNWSEYALQDRPNIDPNQKISLPTISQLELLDHPFYVIYDGEKQKDYTNRFLFQGVENTILTKDCWIFLQTLYGGIPISRLNICLYEKPTEIITQVNLRKMAVARTTDPATKYLVQICRKENWQALTAKLNKYWGAGRLWKFNKGQPKHLLIPSKIIEDEDLSSYELIYEMPVRGKWALAQMGKTASASVPVCGNCGTTEGLRYCSCKLIKYCSSKCQQSHRYNHRKLCQSRKQQEQQVGALLRKYNLGRDETYGGRMGLVGLRNLGNTCYMNSGIQCLSNTRELTEYFMSNRFLSEINSTNPLSSKGYIACCYSKLIREMWNGKDSDVSPWELKKAIGSFSTFFAGYSQQDAQQLINALLEALNQDLNLVKVKPVVELEDDDNRTDQEGSRLGQEMYEKRNKSFISDLFLGQFKATVKCPCGRISKKFDPSTLLTLPIPTTLYIQAYYLGQNCSSLPLRVTMVSLPQDTVDDIRKRLSIEMRARGQLYFYGLDSKFQLSAQFQPTDRAETLRQPSLLFIYQIDISQHSQIVKLEYVTDEKGQRRTSYPRYVSIQKKALSNEMAQQLVFKDMQKYLKKGGTVPARDSYQILLGQLLVQVIFRGRHDLSLQNYTSYRDTIEAPGASSDSVSIYDCLNLFQKEQRLDKDNTWYCNKCKNHVQALKKIELYSVNKILMLGLKKFRYGKKLKTNVIFPVEGFDIGPYIVGNHSKKPMIYDLYAVANHYGTLLGGHYTAFCKNFLRNQWFEFNDDRIGRINPDEVVSSSAYVLFYRRRD